MIGNTDRATNRSVRAKGGCRENPHPNRPAKRPIFEGEKHDRKQCDVGDGVKGEPPDLEQFEGFLVADADQYGSASDEGDSPEEKDGIHGCSVFGMKARKPLREAGDPSQRTLAGVVLAAKLRLKLER